MEHEDDRVETARGEAVDLFCAYITCVLGASRETWISELKGFLIGTLKGPTPDIKHPITAALASRSNFLTQVRDAAHCGQKSVSEIFVHPQNGPKDIQDHPNAGKYVITTAGSFAMSLYGILHYGLCDLEQITPIPVMVNLPNHAISINDPYSSRTPLIFCPFLWPEQSPLASPATHSVYNPQVVLVSQLDGNMPESIQKLYEFTFWLHL